MLAAVGFVLLAGVFVWPFTVDDAFIVARFAKNLAERGHYGMNLGATADGVTGPLWLVPGVAAEWLAPGVADSFLGGSAVTAQKAVGLAATLCAAGVAVRWGEGVRERWATALALTASASVALWAAAGLEAGAAALLVTLAVGAARVNSRWVWLPLALAPWVRPELCPSLLAFVLLARAKHWRGALAALAVSVAAVGAFRWMAFGSPVPMAVFAKPSSVGAGISYTLLGALVATWGVGVRVAWKGRGRPGAESDPVPRAAFLALGVHCAAVAVAGGDWMPGFRLLVPWIPVYAWLYGRGVVAMLISRSPRAALVLSALPLLLGAIDVAVQLPRARASGVSTELHAESIHAWLRSTGGPVALADIGRLVPPDLDVVDLGGVTDARVAHMPGGHMSKAIDMGYLEARAPRVFLLGTHRVDDLPFEPTLFVHPVERTLARSAWFRAHYRFVRQLPLNDDYEYAAYVRRSAAAATSPEPPRDRP